MRARFGGGIDPRLGLIDYSGIARAAEIRARNNRMREEDEERKRQEKMKAVGSIIQTFKQKSDENKKIDLFSENAYRKLGSEDKADQRFLNLFGINEGMFGDMNEKEKMEAIRNTLRTLGIDQVIDLNNAYQLSELKLQGDIELQKVKNEEFDISKITDKDPNTFDKTPSPEKLEELYNQGVRQITVAGQVVPILPPDEEEEEETPERDPRGRLIKVPTIEEPKLIIPKSRKGFSRNPNFR